MNAPQPDTWYRLGILTKDRSGGERTNRNPFGPQTATFRALCKLGTAAKLRVFVFTPSGIDWRARRVRGLAWRRVGDRAGWVPVRCPFPHVVYNRIPERATEHTPAVASLKTRMRKRGIPLFNPSFLDKWDVGKLLQQDAYLSQHTPMTWAYRGFQSVRKPLDRVGALYLKPTGNSMGRGTVKLRKRGGAYSVQRLAGHGAVHRKVYRTPHDIRRVVARIIGRRRYIVQQAIPLSQWNGRSFDIRTLVQKDGSGAWQLTGAAGRLASPGNIVTHVPNGGSRLPLPFLLQESLQLSPSEVSAKVEELTSLAIRAAKAVDADRRRPFGEFSMDVGIDGNAKLWIIEINGKPFRFDEKMIRRTARRNVISYARFLAAQRSA